MNGIDIVDDIYQYLIPMPSISSHTETKILCPIIIETEFSMIKHFRHAIEEAVPALFHWSRSTGE